MSLSLPNENVSPPRYMNAVLRLEREAGTCWHTASRRLPHASESLAPASLDVLVHCDGDLLRPSTRGTLALAAEAL